MQILNRLKQLLKKSRTILRLHNWFFRFKGGKTSNYEIIRRLRLYAPNSAGALRIRSAMALNAATDIFPILCQFLENTGVDMSGSEQCPFVNSLATEKEVAECASFFGKSFDENGSDKKQLKFKITRDI